MQFIKLPNGEYVNIERVDYVAPSDSPNNKWRGHMTVSFEGGEFIELDSANEAALRAYLDARAHICEPVKAVAQ